MAKSISKVQKYLQWSIVPILCSLALGFLLYQDEIFNRLNGTFQFTWSAVVASLFYYLLHTVRERDSWVGLVILFFLTLLTTQSTDFYHVTRDILYVAAIGVSMYAYFRYFRNDSPLNFTRPAFLVGGIYGIAYVASGWIHTILMRNLVQGQHDPGVMMVMVNTAYFGLLIGFAVGAGIGINERFFGARKSA